MKKVSDLSPYTNILPYASEIFGVYQPMLGWRSKRILGRMEKGFAADLSKAFGSLYKRFKGFCRVPPFGRITANAQN